MCLTRHAVVVRYSTYRSLPDVASALAAAELSAAAGAGGDVEELRARVEADENDLDARHELASALFAAGAHELAIEEALALIKKDRKWNDEAGRVLLLKIFDVLGNTHPAVASGRRRLASIILV